MIEIGRQTWGWIHAFWVVHGVVERLLLEGYFREVEAPKKLSAWKFLKDALSLQVVGMPGVEGEDKEGVQTVEPGIIVS